MSRPGNGTPGNGTPGNGTPGNGTPGDGTPGDGTAARPRAGEAPEPSAGNPAEALAEALAGTPFETADGLRGRRVPAGTVCYRVYEAARGPAGAVRFTAPARGAVGTCHFGWTPEAAFVEGFFRRRPVRSVGRADLARCALGRFVLARALTLACLPDAGHPDAAPSDLWCHPAGFDGLEVPTHLAPDQRSLVLWDRAADALPAGVAPAGALVAVAPLDPDGPLVAAWIQRYRFDVFDDR